MTNDIRQFIKIVNTDLNEKFDIVERIANSDPQELIGIVDQMDENRIVEITELLSTINEDDDISEGLRDEAKKVWKTALQSAKNLASGRTFSKLKGVATRLLKRKDVLNDWEKYKAQFGLEGDLPKDIKRFITQKFPELSNKSLNKAQRDVKFKLDDAGNVTNFSNYIDGLARVAGEAAAEKITTGTITDGGDADQPATGRQSPDGKKDRFKFSDPSKPKKMSMAQALRTPVPGEKGSRGSNQLAAIKRAALDKAVKSKHITEDDMKLVAAAVKKDFNSITDQRTIKAMAAIAYHIMK